MSEWFGIFGIIIAAAVVGGGSIGCLGAYIVGMRIPFIGIAISHAAMLGSVAGYLLHLPIFPCALGVSLLSAWILGGFFSPAMKVHSDTHTSILFSVMMGLVFLGMGLMKNDVSPLLGMMWGNLLFVNIKNLFIMILLAVIFAIVCLIFHKELKSILFSPDLARASGINVGRIIKLFLVIAAAIIAANLNIVGGLLLYSLLTCPAAAAYEIGGNLRSVIILSAIFGVASAAGGFAISYQFNLPTGSCIALLSAFIYAAAHLNARTHPGV
ncbi:MAG TPA: metal ABC transporter permease [Candidatus Sumerlaeota bacterium]|nr:MAG: High-affinity zinc uptake system membrane protein ZnuB [candidate division BRC1 bacterium ADurb.Bin183]HOE64000.1 metal ABC transporter permease [Candidatus Sumerlaeota bacterium]HRR30465.1 metal ABC transporter permease [Candidatus Sumerlaeia bacterium]HON51069.1 metal ABC transporter permease [Candidatus Sumerlaeota bacterium]HOR65052.1 metal ABC transporter permease [Candidatus Sumerlaeota bacterium]